MAADQRLTNAIGLAMKAGRLRSGAFAVEGLVRAGQAKLALCDKTASDNTRGQLGALCAAHNVELLLVSELGRWIGKPGHMVAAVTDKNFATMIKSASAAHSAGCGERGGND